MIRLLGLFETPTGEHQARSVRATLEFQDSVGKVSSNVSLHRDLEDAITHAVRTAVADARMLGFGPVQPKGIRLIVQEPPTSELADTSYALAIYGGAISALTGLVARDDVAGTGAIAEDGRLEEVSGIRKKLEASRADGAPHFLVPGRPEDGILFGTPICSTLPAAFVWLGLPAVRSALLSTDRPETIRSLIGTVLEPGGAYYPSGLGAALREIARTNQAVIEAFESNRSDWVRLGLEIAPSLPEDQFDDLCQLLDPRIEFELAWEDPGRRERFVADSIRALAQSPVHQAGSALRAAAALIRVLRCSVDVAPILQSTTLLNAFLSLQELRDKALQLGLPVQAAAQGLQGLLQTMSRISQGTILAPEDARRPALLIQPRYLEGVLDRIDFHIPGTEGVASTSVEHPAALLDDSAGLPLGLRRTDWTPEDSALSSVPLGGDVLQRFGHRNLFLFDDLGDSRATPAAISWGDGSGTWPPSIDTLHLLGTLTSLGLFQSNNRFDRVLDLGCGTGVLGILAARTTQVRKLDLVDNEPSSRLTATTNVLMNFEALHQPRPVPFMHGTEAIRTRECMVRFLGQDARSLPLHRDGERYDLCFCTPPYVPFLSELGDSGMWRAVAGTELLRFVLQTWREFTDRLVVQFSEIALGEIEDSLPSEPPVAIHRVGFRIPPLLRFFSPSEPSSYDLGQAWLERIGGALIDTESPGDPVQHPHGFRFFHDIRTYFLEA